jgi:hypothetical protein
MGLGQVAALAVLPALLIPLLSPFVGEVFPFAFALQLSVLWTAFGMLVFALTFFFSTVLPGAYSPAIASIAGLLLSSALAGLPLAKQYPALDLFQTMRDAQLSIFRGDASLASVATRLPWLALGLYALVALGLVLAASRMIARRDF